MKIKRAVILFVVFLLAVSLTCCTGKAEEQSFQSSEETSMPSEAETPQPEDTAETETETEHPYLSIIFSRKNKKSVSGKELIFFTYDITTKQLKEECILPFESSYASGVVSRYDNAVYYQSNTVPGDYSKGNSLWALDLATGEASIINDENRAYNEILLVDPETLLLMAHTEEGLTMPTLFDLNTETFTYTADANSEPFTQTSGSTTPFYNYKTGKLSYVYWDTENGNENTADCYVAVASGGLMKDTEKIFTYNDPNDGKKVYEAAQISENELLITATEKNGDIWPPLYYSLVFNGGEATLTPTECPYPNAKYIYNLYTIDEGKTLFFYFCGEPGADAGIYSYDTETGELTPILLNEYSGKHFVSFSLVGPGRKTYEEWNEEQESVVGSFPQILGKEEASQSSGSASESSEYDWYMTFEKITEKGSVPRYMKPSTIIIYDENGKPTIIKGGELTREEAIECGFGDKLYSSSMIGIEPNTKVDYSPRGELQNVYYKWAEDVYNLSSPDYYGHYPNLLRKEGA